MEFSAGSKGREQQIIDLFTATFTASEGEEEGALIGGLVHNLLRGTPEPDLFVFTAAEAGAIVGCVCFSRFTYDQDERTVFILAPLAVATQHQGKGIGQRLLEYGLRALRKAHVDVALTYGDPAYYSKIGFTQISGIFARPPFKLKHPEGWLARSLADTELAPLKGSPRCVEALSDPALW